MQKAPGFFLTHVNCDKQLKKNSAKNSFFEKKRFKREMFCGTCKRANRMITCPKIAVFFLLIRVDKIRAFSHTQYLVFRNSFLGEKFVFQ